MISHNCQLGWRLRIASSAQRGCGSSYTSFLQKLTPDKSSSLGAALACGCFLLQLALSLVSEIKMLLDHFGRIVCKF
jgi:hypothetical protein